MRNRRIRFAPVIECDVRAAGGPPQVTPSESAKQSGSMHRRHVKSRSGCRECKLRHVKCDETFPVCLRCQRLGTLCRALPRLEQWQFEVPWISGASSLTSKDTLLKFPCVKKKLLQSWFQTTSRIMVLDHSWNPLSIPLLDYCNTSPSLIHVLQSITAGYQEFFVSSKLILSLEERNMALVELRKELESRGNTIMSYLFTAYLLGVSSTFLDNEIFDYGKEHLFAARSMLDIVLSSSESVGCETTSFITGAYVYWDMTCSVLLDPLDDMLPDNTVLFNHVMALTNKQHPITGFCTSLFYTLGNLGRYCRATLELGIRDDSIERQFEHTLLQWNIASGHRFWEITADAYRNHGLIMLYRLCGRQAGVGLEDASGTDSMAHECALRTIHILSEIPVSSEFLVLQPMPLMTAGAELRVDDTELRKVVLGRFKALYSFNRLPANLHAIQLLEELWELRDLGVSISWVELMLTKNWRLRLG